MRETTEVIYEATRRVKRSWVEPETAEYHADGVAHGIKRILKESGAGGVVLGNSGGLDSAVTGALCTRAGVSVYSVRLPCGESMKNSGSDDRANETADKFGWRNERIDIKPMCDAFRAANPLMPAVSDKVARLAEMNLQARMRVVVMRDIAAQLGYLVVGTDNLTEMMLGYFTKDGNGCDLRPIGMLLKTELWMMAPVIGVPERTIIAVPSAELEDGQTDEDEMGFSYQDADRYIRYGTCGDFAIDRRIAKMIEATQHKRTPVWMYNG